MGLSPLKLPVKLRSRFLSPRPLRGSKGRPLCSRLCGAPKYRRPVCSLQHKLPHLDLWNSESFPEFPRADSFSERTRGPRGSRFIFLDLEPRSSLDPAAQAKNFFVFGCGWWYDREIVLLPPLCEYRERLRERLPGNSASGPHSSRRVQAPSRP